MDRRVEGKERDGGREGRRYDLMFPFQVSSRRTGQHVPERVSSPTSDGGKAQSQEDSCTLSF